MSYHEAVDVEKTIQFLLDQQAKFFAGMEGFRAGMEDMRQEFRDELRQQQEAQGKINAALGKAMLGLTDHIERLTAAQAATDERLNKLAASQAALTASQAALAASQAATDERLNALIAVVDGVVRRPPPK